ncbi:MAG TPA: hypothetical protein VJ643_03780 [Nitrososphaera sp.]|nr:hypothetical protein [Nitrososphaera sp.]
MKTKEFRMSGDIYITTMRSLHNSQKAQIHIVEYFGVRFKAYEMMRTSDYHKQVLMQIIQNIIKACSFCSLFGSF